LPGLAPHNARSCLVIDDQERRVQHQAPLRALVQQHGYDATDVDATDAQVSMHRARLSQHRSGVLETLCLSHAYRSQDMLVEDALVAERLDRRRRKWLASNSTWCTECPAYVSVSSLLEKSAKVAPCSFEPTASGRGARP